MSKTKIEVLKDVIVISLGQTTIWTGRAKMTAEDLGMTSDQLPPDALASLGSKRIINKDDLKPLNNVRYKMRRDCMEVGTRFAGGIAVGKEEAPALVKKLNEHVEEGERLKVAFMATLAQKIRMWHNANPTWSHILKAGTPELARIERRISFGYNAYLTAPSDDPLIAQCFLREVEAMGSTLAHEISKEAKQFVAQSLKDGREKGSQKTVEPMRRLVRKIEALRFIDPALGSMAEVLRAVLRTVPNVGQVQAEPWMNLCRAANLIADQDRFKDTADAIKSGSKTMAAVLQDLVGDEAAFMDSQASTQMAVPFEAVDAPVSASQGIDENALKAMPKADAPVRAEVPETAVPQPVLGSFVQKKPNYKPVSF